MARWQPFFCCAVRSPQKPIRSNTPEIRPFFSEPRTATLPAAVTPSSAASGRAGNKKSGNLRFFLTGRQFDSRLTSQPRQPIGRMSITLPWHHRPRSVAIAGVASDVLIGWAATVGRFGAASSSESRHCSRQTAQHRGNARLPSMGLVNASAQTRRSPRAGFSGTSLFEIAVQHLGQGGRRMEAGNAARIIQRVADVVEPDNLTIGGVEKRGHVPHARSRER